jgi:diguanylate cyclase (GGDEF)-like protein
LKRFAKRPLTTALSLAVTGALVLAGVQALGQYALGRMLEQNALRLSELWTRTLGGVGKDIETALAGVDARTLETTLNITGIDRLLLIPSDRDPLALYGSDGERDLRLVADGALRDPGTPLYGLASAVYSRDAIGWFGRTSYHSWVVFPPGQADAPRLALRIDQTDTAADLAASFEREVLFSGGVAVITFIAFMAGFSYRQRQLAAENEAIRHLALHDELTTLPNRKQFEEFMAETLEAAEQEGGKAALFLLDLDGFKSVNDTLGHPVGDALLKACARRLKASLRSGDLLARLSGDEFVIVVPRVTDPAMLAPLAERVLGLLSSPFRVEGHEIQVGCSIGLVVAPDNGSDIATLMSNADFALYRAKSEGRRTWRFFDPKMAKDLASRRTLEDGLRHALENDHFELLYQPQIELANGRVVGYEAMLRWRLPGQGLVPASVFVSVAEETGLVVPIGEWVIRQAAADCARIPAGRSVAINLSATQLKRDGIETFILETLKAHRIPASRIEIEVNETVLGRNESEMLARLEALRDGGVHVVMDSFGVGTLSLGLLSRCSFDKIKIDRSFLLEGDEAKSAAVLAAVCSLGRSLGFRVAGLGVESLEQAQFLRSAGCSQAQGYYFSPPLPLEEILKAEEEKRRPPLAQIA